MRFAKRVFQITGAYGVIMVLPQYFNEGWVGRHFPPVITHPEYYYGFVGATLAWQFVFLVIATDPARYRPLMIPAFLEKILYTIAVIILYLQDRTASFFLTFGLIDLFFAVLVLIAYRKTAPVRKGTGGEQIFARI